jgi:anti-anti-sigma factor
MANLHVIRLDGEIDVSQKYYVEWKLAEIDRFGPDAVVVLDLTDVPYVDTTFLNALVAVRNRTDHVRRDDTIRLVAPEGSIVRILFGAAKLDRVFPLFDNMSAATRPVVFTERHALPREFEDTVWARTHLEGVPLKARCVPICGLAKN